jgi:peroxiredoxin Q/BCP
VASLSAADRRFDRSIEDGESWTIDLSRGYTRINADLKTNTNGRSCFHIRLIRVNLRLTKTMSKQNGPQTGASAPDFTLEDGNGDAWRLEDKRGKVVVLLFYPGDETPICTRQLCSVRDRWDDYAATGAEVVGISTDSVESHKKFAEHHDLPLRLLSDANGEVAKLYGAQSLIPGKVARSVFVIDANGVIRHRDVRPLGLFRPKDDETLKAIVVARKAGS